MRLALNTNLTLQNLLLPQAELTFIFLTKNVKNQCESEIEEANKYGTKKSKARITDAAVFQNGHEKRFLWLVTRDTKKMSFSSVAATRNTQIINKDPLKNALKSNILSYVIYGPGHT
jgi:hypothetical protein